MIRQHSEHYLQRMGGPNDFEGEYSETLALKNHHLHHKNQQTQGLLLMSHFGGKELECIVAQKFHG